MLAQVLLAVFFAGVAVAGLRGWGVDTRDVRYVAAWPARSRSPPHPATTATSTRSHQYQEKGPLP